MMHEVYIGKFVAQLGSASDNDLARRREHMRHRRHVEISHSNAFRLSAVEWQDDETRRSPASS